LPVARSCRARLPQSQPGLPILREYYDALLEAHGEQHWWPAETPFEVVLGAILVQNTSWINVERAIANLRQAGLLSPAALEKTSRAKLARLIRPSGYFRQKARKVQEFLRFVRREYNGSLSAMLRTPTVRLRVELLGIHGIGPETADSILLYAGNHPVFVADAYARRILERHGLIHGKESYEELRGLFERSLPNDASLFNEYHALIVHIGKHHCRSRVALCSNCALGRFLPASREQQT
jgi:endonuclease-3 related protein